jgi:Na+-driven multidrug efflux pump
VPLAYIGSLYFGLPGFFGGAVCGNFLMAIISWRTFNRAISAEHQLLETAAETT